MKNNSEYPTLLRKRRERLVLAYTKDIEVLALTYAFY